MNPLISIIIPVYNAEKYIEECIKSLCTQTLKDCEFIFINDGSKDSSRNIIEKYSHIDSRVKLMNQENQGVSIARNEGIRLAKGEYVGFVDADDFIEDDMLEVLYKEISEKNIDLIISNFQTQLDGQKGISKLDIPIGKILDKKYIEENIIYKFISSNELNTVCTKLYKNKLITRYNIKFPEKVDLGEDGLFNLRYIIQCKNILYIDYLGYHYREVEGSATRNILTKDYFKRSLNVYLQKLPELTNFNMDNDKVKKLKITKFINEVISNVYIYLIPKNGMKLSRKLQYVKNMIQNKYVMESMPIYIKQNYIYKSRYEKFIIKFIYRKSIVGLYLLTMYSWSRNRC